MLHVYPQYFFFFFSSRRRHTRCSRDWSSDVCSSDLFPAGVAGHADEAREFLFAGFEEAFEGAIRRFDFFEIVGVREAVDVDEVDMIGLQTREAAFEAPEEGVTSAVENFRGEPDVFATRGHHLADTGFALAVAVSESGVKIRDA